MTLSRHLHPHQQPVHLTVSVTVLACGACRRRVPVHLTVLVRRFCPRSSITRQVGGNGPVPGVPDGFRLHAKWVVTGLFSGAYINQSTNQLATKLQDYKLTSYQASKLHCLKAT